MNTHNRIRGIVSFVFLAMWPIMGSALWAQQDSVSTEQEISAIKDEQALIIRKMGLIALEIDPEFAAMSRKDKIDRFYQRQSAYAKENEAFANLLREHRALDRKIARLSNMEAKQEGEAAEDVEVVEAYFLPDANELGIPELPESIKEKTWTWDHVHRYISVHKRGDFTEEEIHAIAGFDMIQLNADQGSLNMARRLKAYNPNMICIGYRNLIIWHETFDTDLFRNNPDWFLKNPRNGQYETHGKTGKKAKKPLFDMRVPAMRDWWIADIASQCETEELDGVLIDAMAKILTGWGPKRRSLNNDPQAARDYNDLVMNEVLLKNIRQNGNKGLIIANALRSGYSDCLKSFVDVYWHGSYMEWIEGSQEYYEEGLSHLIDTLIQIGKDPGDKVLCFQFVAQYPPPPKVDVNQAENNIPRSTIMPEMGEAYNAKGKTHEDIVKEMREAFPYKLAIFLICANKYSYMGYSSTHLANNGQERWAPEYPEFSKKIGTPLGHAIKKGKYYYEREFEHVSVKLNVETREAILDWK